jgi:hypothetical protein
MPLAVYGHELIRYLLFSAGYVAEAYQSSTDWSGKTGRLWNIAETLAVKMEGATK